MSKKFTLNSPNVQWKTHHIQICCWLKIYSSYPNTTRKSLLPCAKWRMTYVLLLTTNATEKCLTPALTSHNVTWKSYQNHQNYPNLCTQQWMESIKQNKNKQLLRYFIQKQKMNLFSKPFLIENLPPRKKTLHPVWVQKIKKVCIHKIV